MQKNQTPIWNLIFSSLESAISYKFLIFLQIPKRRVLLGGFLIFY